MRAPSVFVVGSGRLASALIRGLRDAGWAVGAHARSAPGRARLRKLGVVPLPLDAARSFDLVFLAVSDADVAAATHTVAPHLGAGAVVAHGAGALSLAPLAAARRRGCHAGSLHPMQALAGGRFTRGVTAAVDGDPVARRLLGRVAAELGLLPVRVPERGRVPYHAASAIAANLAMALADLAVEAWARSGAPRARAIPALVPIMRAAVENLAERGLPGALTGPASRGDAEVVRRHLATLRGDAAEVYRLLSLRLVRLAERGGLDARKAEAVRRVLRPARLRAARQPSRRRKSADSGGSVKASE